ncbi:MAG: hypothetical protein JWL89_157 [Candidatus Saccharibacteria bacterium]|nr:hypothetical protein [Candidatus Saccharibacteria bacterium]
MQIKTVALDKINAFVRRLSDIRFAGQVVFVILVLMISWSGIKTIQTNYGLQKQISTLRQQNGVKKLQNNNLSLQNEYLKSNQYLELSARQSFGLAVAGEKEVVVPSDVALKYTVDTPATTKLAEASVKQPAYQRHIQSWINFFLHRQQ